MFVYMGWGTYVFKNPCFPNLIFATNVPVVCFDIVYAKTDISDRLAP